jgi:hypothetical protein
MKNANMKCQVITTEGKWPFVGNAYVNRNGSISIYLDEGVQLSGGQKLYLRPAGQKPADADAEPATTSK